MPFQSVFKRYELKYLLTTEQKERVLQAMEPYMKLDKYGRTTIRNLYFDTDNYLLIRRSIEKPVYKEKLRIRSYSKATEDSTVFVELKKKYKHVDMIFGTHALHTLPELIWNKINEDKKGFNVEDCDGYIVEDINK